MSVTAVVGGHWGDEGKGRVVDALAAQADLVIRFNGGSNAGHTIVTERGTFRLHLIPSGIFHPGVTSLIGPGVVLNPTALFEEINTLAAAGVDTSGLRISERTHLIFPHHLAQDALEEEARGPRAHGTTRQGIWPVYADKAARIGLRVGDLFESAYLEEAVSHLVSRKGPLLTGLYGQGLDAAELLSRCETWRDLLAPYVVDSHALVMEVRRAGGRMLLEGHLGVMRDLDWGLYPYVTSSTCLPGGAAAGAGIPAGLITEVIGVVKSYTTAVGAGPLPTELRDETGDRLRTAGEEYGASTGRPRRCGWFDAVAGRFAAEVCGFTALAVMKLDVLDGFDRVKVCVAYHDRHHLLTTVPRTPVMARVEPVYEELPGWTDTAGCRSVRDLPPEAHGFLDRLEELVGVPVTLVGVGPGRDSLLRRRQPTHGSQAARPAAAEGRHA